MNNAKEASNNSIASGKLSNKHLLLEDVEVLLDVGQLLLERLHVLADFVLDHFAPTQKDLLG